MRRSAWALIGLAAAVAVGSIALTVDWTGAGSPRKAAVARLLAAARAGDEEAMARLLAPDARLIGHSSFDTQIVPAVDVAELARRCPTVAMSEAVGVVAVELGCAHDRRGELVLDFAFCGDRIAGIVTDERGRWVLSPLARELGERIGRRLAGEPPRCG